MKLEKLLLIHHLFFEMEEHLEACSEIDEYGKDFWLDYYRLMRKMKNGQIINYLDQLESAWQHFENDFILNQENYKED